MCSSVEGLATSKSFSNNILEKILCFTVSVKIFQFKINSKYNNILGNNNYLPQGQAVRTRPFFLQKTNTKWFYIRL